MAYVVEILSRFQQNPTKDHWTIDKKELTYLKRTKAHMLYINIQTQVNLPLAIFLCLLEGLYNK